MFNPYFSGMQDMRGAPYNFLHHYSHPYPVGQYGASSLLSPKMPLKLSEFEVIREEIQDGLHTEITLPSQRYLSNEQFINILREVCAPKRHITRLDVSSCELDDKAITDEVILLLIRNTSLRSINLSFNNFRLTSERIFVSILQANYYLTFFNFHSSTVSPDMTKLADTYILRNKEIHQTIQKNDYYFEFLKQIRRFLPTGVDVIAVEYCIETTSSEAVKFIYDYYIPYLHYRVIRPENTEIASKKTTAMLSTLTQAFLSKNEQLEEITPTFLIKFHDEKVKKSSFIETAPKSHNGCCIM